MLVFTLTFVNANDAELQFLRLVERATLMYEGLSQIELLLTSLKMVQTRRL